MIENIRPKKSLGQNFLRDPHYLRKIIHAAQIGHEDRVLEIGPGQGHLTQVLLERAACVRALEIDERLIPFLRDRFQDARNFELLHADALEYDYDLLDGTWKVVANLPYYISTPILQALIRHRSRFSGLTLMLQKEVAERIAAPPGGREYGYLSVLVQLYTVPRIAFKVPPNAFTPRPEVDSAAMTLTLRERPAVTAKDEDFLLRVVKAAFSQRRKTLRNALKQLEVRPDILAAAEQRTGIDLGRRAETLSVEEFGLLADALDAGFSP